MPLTLQTLSYGSLIITSGQRLTFPFPFVHHQPRALINEREELNRGNENSSQRHHEKEKKMSTKDET